MQDVFSDEMDGGDSPGGAGRLFALAIKWGGAALSLLLVAMIVLWVYRLGVRDAQEIPVIQALDSPARIAPENPGGTVMPNQGLEVNGILGGEAARNPSETRLAPATLPLGDDDTPAVAGPLRDQLFGTVPVEDLAPAEAGISVNPQDEIDTLLRQALGLEEDVVPTEEPALPAIRPRGRPEGLPSVAAVPAAPSGPLDPATLVPGTLLLQLGAFNEVSQAERQWDRLVSAHSDLLGDKQYFVQRVEQNGQIFFRLRMAGVTDENAQSALCQALKARFVECVTVTVR